MLKSGPVRGLITALDYDDVLSMKTGVRFMKLCKQRHELETRQVNAIPCHDYFEF